ncbi:MmpS family transport accessory protein [Mycobacterium sp. DL592]|uniref:MmpS family transport accessory protein n=1 Tax=Mycobacterium sp. DL592 TaxID=2675524 RepID=UPI001420DAB9|nr:MmpS family transport accessory protein [Mycobacterium sp. DL592]
MSGPNPPHEEPGGQPSDQPTPEYREDTSGTGFQAYSAPESEQWTAGPYVAPDPRLYDYDNYDSAADVVEDAEPPKWPWVVGVTAIIAAIALVVSVSLLVTSTDTNELATPATTTSVSLPPVQDEITTTVPPPPTTTTPAGPRQVTYSVTGTKAPGDIITVTYVDASGRRRTQRNVYIPWSLTVTPISQSDVGSVQASSLFLVSKLNCAITTSDGTVLSSNQNNAAQTSC